MARQSSSVVGIGQFYYKWNNNKKVKANSKLLNKANRRKFRQNTLN